MRVLKKDIHINVVASSGYLSLSYISDDNARFSFVYGGYTKREAIALFITYIKLGKSD